MKYYYFAYGSNLEERQMEVRCSKDNFEKIGIAVLRNYRLTFTKRSEYWNSPFADIIKAHGNVVLGLLYIVNEIALNRLDEVEGYTGKKENSLYVRIPVNIETEKDKVTAYTYKSDDPGFDQPTNEYVNTIIEGMMENNFPDYYIQHLILMKT